MTANHQTFCHITLSFLISVLCHANITSVQRWWTCWWAFCWLWQSLTLRTSLLLTCSMRLLSITLRQTGCQVCFEIFQSLIQIQYFVMLGYIFVPHI